MKKFNIKLRHLIIGVITLSFLLSFVSSVFSSYQGTLKSIKEHSLETNRVYAEKLSQMVDLYLQNALHTLEYSATTISNKMDDRQVLLNEVERIQSQENLFNSVVIADADGLILAGAPEEFGLTGKRIQSKEGLAVIKNQQPSISDPYKAATGKDLITISYPIFSDENQFIGMMNGTIYIYESNLLHTIFGEHTYQDGSYVYVVDSTGKIIYHQDSLRVGDDASSNEVVEKLMSGNSGAQPVTNTVGEKMFAGYSTILDTNWGVVAQTPETVAMESVGDQVNQMLLIELPLIIISMIVMLFVVRKIVKPLQEIAQIAEHSVNQNEIDKLSNLKVWYYEALQIKMALIESFTFLHGRVNYFMDQSTIDPLTGLTNRRTLDDVIQNLIEQNIPFSIIMLDLDHFKKVNDTYGHAVGDEVLKFLAEQMKRVTRETDFCCRYGGEEFTIILPKTDMEKAYTIAERLRIIMETTDSPCGRPVTLSAGISSYPNTKDARELMECADKAMYKAKNSGRNQVVIGAK